MNPASLMSISLSDDGSHEQSGTVSIVFLCHSRRFASGVLRFCTPVRVFRGVVDEAKRFVNKQTSRLSSPFVNIYVSCSQPEFLRNLGYREWSAVCVCVCVCARVCVHVCYVPRELQ